MTTSSALIGVDNKVDDALKHYGVKGMKWGKKTAKSSEEDVPVASGGSYMRDEDLKKLEGPEADALVESYKQAAVEAVKKQKRGERLNLSERNAQNRYKEAATKLATIKKNRELDTFKAAQQANIDKTGVKVRYGSKEAAQNGRTAANTVKDPTQTTFRSDITTKELLARREERRRKKSVKHDALEVELESYLMHYGVKGMKWGVRRELKKKSNASERAEYIAEKDAKWRSSVSNPKKAVRVAKRASREATKMTKELNAKYKDQGYKIGGNAMRKNSLDNRRNKLARAQYDTELKGILEYSLDKAALKVYKNSPTRLYQVNLSRNSDGTVSAKIAPRQNAKLDKQLASITKRSNKQNATIAKRDDKLKHSDEDDGMGDLSGLELLEFKLTQDSDGFVTSVEVPGDDLGHDELSDFDDYLMHYGVKGMRWGVRKDGKPQGHQGGSSKSKSKSASDKLKERASKLSSSAKKKIRKATDPKERAKRIIRKQKRKADIAEAKAEANARIAEAEKKAAAARKATETTRTATTAKSGSGSMSDKELKAVVERMNLEKQYAKHMSDAKPKKMSSQLMKFAKDTAIDYGKQRLKAEINRNLGNNFDKLFKVADAAASKGDPTPEPEAKNPFTFKARKPKTPKAPKPKDSPRSEPRTQSPPTRPTPPTYGPSRPALMSPPNPSILALPAPKPKGPSSGPSASARMKDNPTVAKFGKVSMDQVQAYKEGRPYKPFDPRRRR